MIRLATCFLIALTAGACSNLWPTTDIVAINSEDVGNYTVSAQASKDTLVATVCAERLENASAIAARVAHQLYGKGYRTVQFDVWPIGAHSDTEATHVIWTDSDNVRVTGRDRTRTPSAPAVPCDPRAVERYPASGIQ